MILNIRRECEGRVVFHYCVVLHKLDYSYHRDVLSSIYILYFIHLSIDAWKLFQDEILSVDNLGVSAGMTLGIISEYLRTCRDVAVSIRRRVETLPEEEGEKHTEEDVAEVKEELVEKFGDFDDQSIIEFSETSPDRSQLQPPGMRRRIPLGFYIFTASNHRVLSSNTFKDIFQDNILSFISCMTQNLPFFKHFNWFS